MCSTSLWTSCSVFVVSYQLNRKQEVFSCQLTIRTWMFALQLKIRVHEMLDSQMTRIQVQESNQEKLEFWSWKISVVASRGVTIRLRMWAIPKKEKQIVSILLPNKQKSEDLQHPRQVLVYIHTHCWLFGLFGPLVIVMIYLGSQDDSEKLS